MNCLLDVNIFSTKKRECIKKPVKPVNPTVSCNKIASLTTRYINFDML